MLRTGGWNRVTQVQSCLAFTLNTGWLFSHFEILNLKKCNFAPLKSCGPDFKMGKHSMFSIFWSDGLIAQTNLSKQESRKSCIRVGFQFSLLNKICLIYWEDGLGALESKSRVDQYPQFSTRGSLICGKGFSIVKLILFVRCEMSSFNQELGKSDF